MPPPNRDAYGQQQQQQPPPPPPSSYYSREGYGYGPGSWDGSAPAAPPLPPNHMSHMPPGYGHYPQQPQPLAPQYGGGLPPVPPPQYGQSIQPIIPQSDPYFPNEYQKLSTTQHERLIKNYLSTNKRLSLFLDIDHTLVHATRELKAVDLMKPESPFKNEVFEIYFPNPYGRYFIKLRPYLIQFLFEISQMYDIILYTMGSRKYAEEVARVLEEQIQMHYKQQKLFINNRIVSREDHGDFPKVCCFFFLKFFCFGFVFFFEKK